MTLFITTLVVLFLLSLFVQVALLWLTCKLFRQPVSFGKAAAAVLALFLFNIAAAVGVAFLPFSLGSQLALILLEIGMALLLGAVALILVLRLRVVKAFLVTIVWQVMLVGYSIVLLLGLKTFLLEAFVTPSGNMAETLRGYHKEVECPDCGLSFSVNAAMEADPQAAMNGMVINGCTCPNCMRQIRLVNPSLRHPREGEQAGGFREIPEPRVSGGDRVVVGKGLLAGSGFPQRLDLVVFKYPEKQELIYLKRVAGLPGETIAIHGGDLYRLKPEDSPKYDDPGNEELWKRHFMHANDEAAREKWKAGKFEIIRKNPEQILATRRLVYDADHPAKDLKENRWQPDNEAWESSDGRAFTHVGKGGDFSFVTYRHLLRGNGGKPSLITDFMGYNSGESLGMLPGGEWGRPDWREPNGVNWVGDLILECEVKIEKAEGELVLELVHSNEWYQAKWDLATGQCDLSRIRGSKVEKLGSRPTNLTSGTHTVRLANIDRRLAVWIGKDLPFGDGIDHDGPVEKGPDLLDLIPARIGCKKAEIRIGKVKLHRDLYITIGNDSPASPDEHVESWTEPATWVGLRNMPVRTMYIQPGHYFCLGDNPTASADSRLWGVVPERLLLGKVWLVYYPFSRAAKCAN